MTPKEKARELVDKYDETLTYLESKSKAKQCALIAVDEIREHASPYFIENQDGKFVSFWQEVKQEIDKL
jgi:uncharacterized protein YxeA